MDRRPQTDSTADSEAHRGQPPTTKSEPAPPASTGTLPASRQRGLLFLPPDWLPRALVLGDAVIVALSAPVAYWIRFGSAGQVLPFGPYALAIPVAIAIYLLALAINRQYTSWRGRTLADQLISLYSGIGLAGVLMLAAIEVGNLGLSYSRLTILHLAIISLILMTGERYLLRQYETRLRRQGIGTERVLMVGTGAGSELLIRRMNMFPQYGFHVVGVATDDPVPGESYVGVPVVGSVQDLPNLVRSLEVDQVFLALPGDKRGRLLHLIKLCEDQNLEFKIVPDLLEVMSTRVVADAIDGLPLVGIQHSRLRGAAAMLKRLIDIAVSALALVILSPILLVTFDSGYFLTGIHLVDLGAGLEAGGSELLAVRTERQGARSSGLFRDGPQLSALVAIVAQRLDTP